MRLAGDGTPVRPRRLALSPVRAALPVLMILIAAGQLSLKLAVRAIAATIFGVIFRIVSTDCRPAGRGFRRESAAVPRDFRFETNKTDSNRSRFFFCECGSMRKLLRLP